MSKIKSSGGRTFSMTCMILGREDEGRKAILVRKKANSRVAPIGPDGLTSDGGEKVETAKLIDVKSVEDDTADPTRAISTVMGERGTITIPSEVRRQLRLKAGSHILVRVVGDAIVIQPAEIRARMPLTDEALVAMVAGVTPSGGHGEDESFGSSESDED